jgi:hypothetical protein
VVITDIAVSQRRGLVRKEESLMWSSLMWSSLVWSSLMWSSLMWSVITDVVITGVVITGVDITGVVITDAVITGVVITDFAVSQRRGLVRKEESLHYQSIFMCLFLLPLLAKEDLAPIVHQWVLLVMAAW